MRSAVPEKPINHDGEFDAHLSETPPGKTDAQSLSSDDLVQESMQSHQIIKAPTSAEQAASSAITALEEAMAAAEAEGKKLAALRGKATADGAARKAKQPKAIAPKTKIDVIELPGLPDATPLVGSEPKLSPPKKSTDAKPKPVKKAALKPKESVTVTLKPADDVAVTGVPSSKKRSDEPPSSASPLTYNPVLADRAVRAKNLLTDRRFLKMAKTLMRFSLEFAADKVLKSKNEDEIEMRKRSARRLRQALVELGPTFIKLGQFLSVRRDCLSAEMADELALLQDKVPPFPFELVRKTIISELGAPPEKIFQSFEEKPIASASIGQVHKAVLLDGKPVVVKVQRPDLARRFYQDLGCMRLLARWGLLIKPEGQWQSWIELSDEFGRNLFQELNYLLEGRNADRVRVMLKDQEEIQVPRVYWKYTGRRALTLEYCPGIKIDKVKELESKGFNLAKIGNQLVSCYLEMVLMHGIFHADPHAGNLSIAPDGRIIIYDFGMMGEITDEQKEGITGCIAAVIKKDTDELVKHLKTLGIVDNDAQLEPIKRTVQPFIDYYAGKPLLDLDFTHLEHDIDQIADERALQLPATLAYLLRAGSSLEGIARTLKPNFSFVEAAKPPLKKWVMSRPHYAASLVKVFIDGNLSIGQDAFLKLTNRKSSETSTKTTKDDKVSKISAKPPAVDLAASAAHHEEIVDLRARIFMLENRLKEHSKQRRLLAAMGLWLVFSTTASFVPECRPYVTYFLIGNGVMGAIIMWHLVIHLRPEIGPKKKGSSRGQRR